MGVGNGRLESRMGVGEAPETGTASMSNTHWYPLFAKAGVVTIVTGATIR